MAKKTKNRYELKEKLGEGGMGVVWRAYDTVLNVDVALKMLLDVSDASALKQFYDEGNRQAALVHPNVIEIRDLGSFDEDGTRQPYIVMPLLRGKTLADLIRSTSRPVATERCIDIFTQVCRGLQAAHDHGLLHRDIKPSNIFVLDDDSVKIIDFGVAHRLDLTRSVGQKGTLLYMSPEQLLMKPLTRASDVFSLAVTCYEALTGKHPFLRASDQAIVDAIQHLNPPPASSLNPEVSSTLSQVVHKAMAKHSAYRFSSAKEFGDYLRRAHYNESFTVFDPEKFAPRLEKASEAYERGDLRSAQELVNELESEGYLSTRLQELAGIVRSAVQKRDVDQLLESARARMQDGEYRLALQRVDEALEIDSRHQEALALRHDIESRRADADVVEWLKVGRQHLQKFSFAHARQAAQRIFEVKPGDNRAAQFLKEVERKEVEFERIREEKNQLYAAALDAEQRNDITSALSKLKHVLELERQAPEIQEPGRTATLEGLYNKLHAEHEAIAKSYAEAKQAVERGDYAVAAQLCDNFLERYPQHTLFKALKFDNDQRWRRAFSMRIIEVEENAEHEPDLDLRVSMLERIVAESPDVIEFQRLLQAAREKRDLVNGIVARARALAEREQFGEALVQWETLQTIHPDFPGLDFELDHMSRRRQFAERVARKNQWTVQINQALEEQRFDEALRLLTLAKEDFPQDAELLGIEEQILDQQSIASQTQDLIQAARLAIDRGDFSEGLQGLRQAYEISANGASATAGLIEGLLTIARASQNDPKQVRAHLQEILSLDSKHHGAGEMLRFLDWQIEQEQLNEQASRFLTLSTPVQTIATEASPPEPQPESKPEPPPAAASLKSVVKTQRIWLAATASLFVILCTAVCILWATKPRFSPKAIIASSRIPTSPRVNKPTPPPVTEAVEPPPTPQLQQSLPSQPSPPLQQPSSTAPASPVPDYEAGVQPLTLPANPLPKKKSAPPVAIAKATRAGAPPAKNAPPPVAHFDVPPQDFASVPRPVNPQPAQPVILNPPSANTNAPTAQAAEPPHDAPNPRPPSLFNPALDPWEKDAWDFDKSKQALIHKRGGFGLFAAQPSRGTYVFTAPLSKSHLFGKTKLEWVADFKDPRNYLLFSLDNNGFSSFVVHNGEKFPHAETLSMPKLQQYSFQIRILPGRITTSIQDGATWKLLQDWNDLPQDSDSGRFGFKDQITVYHFSFADVKPSLDPGLAQVGNQYLDR